MFAVLLAVAIQPMNCHVIDSDRIYGRDLAAAVPVFAALAPDREMAFSPMPGQQRVFHPGELRRIAKANNLNADFAADVCFAWSLAVPSRESILAAMSRTLKGRDARIEIVDRSLVPAPKGEFVFPLSGLSGVSKAPVVWRGYVTYAGARHFNIWARVNVTVRESLIIASETLRMGEPIHPDQLRTETYTGPLLRETPLTELSQAVGMITRQVIPSGSVILQNLVEDPFEVERGDLVDVIVQSDQTRIEAQGVAEEHGHRGAVVTVRNAKSGRKFRARVEDKRKVLVVPGGPSGLAVEGEKS